MSLPLRSAQAAALRDETRVLVERASDHEQRLDALVEAIEAHMRHAEAALSDALEETDVRLDHVRRVLRTQVQESRIGAAATRRLSSDAHEQHAAAVRLLTHLDRGLRIHDKTDDAHSDPEGVLVADDYREFREAMATVLRNAGFVVRTAANGLEALLAAYEMRPAVVLMDVAMPVLDGIEATRLIKSADATRHVRVIAYTGNPVADDAPARKLFAAVLQKPVNPAVLVATVQHVASL
jgi:two-component system, cell cycle response regulator DivK